MWLGKWNQELSILYEMYYENFDIEPDCYDDIDYDDISYNEFKLLVKKCIIKSEEFPVLYDP